VPGDALVDPAIGLWAGPRGMEGQVPGPARDFTAYERAAPALEAALWRAARDPEVFPHLAAALVRLGRQPSGAGRP
jgi:hypothetical protein